MITIKQICPRCGKKELDPIEVRNALSRYADVYICSVCGTDEGMRDAFGMAISLEDWYMNTGKELENE